MSGRVGQRTDEHWIALVEDLRTRNAKMLAALYKAEIWLDAAYDQGEGREAYDDVCAAIAAGEVK